jgi:SAM-dependent methyltransferase
MPRLREGFGRAVGKLRRIADPLVPPDELIEGTGGGDYIAVGDSFFALFRRAGLRPDDDLLDVGCRSGRMARPLAGWLQGRYEGFDVAPEAIEWCRSRITRRHPNFDFTLLDVANDLYNPNGSTSAASVRFPYEDDAFDFAVVASVFTHLVPAELLHYLDELARVVRGGGRVFATYFLLDPEVEAALSEGRAWRALPDREGDAELGKYRLADASSPSVAVAYRRDRIEAAHAARGLAIETLWLGAWGGREGDGVTAQDVTVSRVGS